jgi:hypothetical protein
MLRKKKADRIECLKCGKEKVPSNFYINANPLFSSERMEVCKDCINEYIGEKDSDGYLDRITLVLALLNKPFLRELWQLRGQDWSKYIPQLSSFHQYKGLTFANSDLLSEKNQVLVQMNEPQISGNDNEVYYTPEEKQALINFWGRGFSDEDYEYLQNEYEKFLNSYECDSYAMELLFQEAAQVRLTIKKKREKNESVDKELKTLQDLLGSANIKPVQETGANATEQATFGTLIKKFENERPIPEPDEAWKDVDGIRKYINIWFLGHLCRMMGIKNEYSEAYEEEIKKYKVEAPTYEEDTESEGVS